MAWKAIASLTAFVTALNAWVRSVWHNHVSAAEDRTSRSGNPACDVSSQAAERPVPQALSPGFVDERRTITAPSHREGEPPPTRDGQIPVTPPIDNEGGGFGLQHLHDWLSVAALLAAPATLVTSLCYVFGRSYYAIYYDYFGIDVDTIGFTNTDYVLASVNLFVGLALPLVFFSVLALWFVARMRRMADVGRWHLIRATGAFAVVTGGLLLLIPVADLLGYRSFAYMLGYAGIPIALGVGATLMAGGGWLIQKAALGATPNPYRVAQRGSLVIALGAVLFSLYWLIGIYASDKADERARSMARSLWHSETAVEIYSRDRIAIPPGLIKESVFPGVDGQQGLFRYQCFRSLGAKSDRWVLVPAKWTPGELGYALILDVDSSKSVVMMRLGRPDRIVMPTTQLQCPEVMAQQGR